MTAEEMLDSVQPMNIAAALDVVRAFLAERGDVSANVIFVLSVQQEDPTAFEREAMKLRASHFLDRGLRVPPLSGSEQLE